MEEKRQIIEYQLKEELYNWRSDVRPNIWGKFTNEEGQGGEWSMSNPSANTLLRANADLSPAMIAKAIAKVLKKQGFSGAMLGKKLVEQRIMAISQFLAIC